MAETSHVRRNDDDICSVQDERARLTFWANKSALLLNAGCLAEKQQTIYYIRGVHVTIAPLMYPPPPTPPMLTKMIKSYKLILLVIDMTNTE